MLRSRAKHRPFQMDTGKAPAFLFKRHKIEDYSYDWHNTALPPAVLSSSDPIRKPRLLSTSQRSRKRKQQQSMVHYQFLFFFSSRNNSSFTSGIFFYFLPPPPNQPTQWRKHRSKRHLWPLTAHTSDNLHCLSSPPHCNCDKQQWPWTSCQFTPTHCLNCTDPRL